MSSLIIKVCEGRSCSERFSPYIRHRLESDHSFYSYPADISIESCLCQGRCQEGPTVAFGADIQTRMNPIKASELLKKKVDQWKQRSKNL